MPHSNVTPDPTPIGVAPGRSLADIQSVARQKEEIYGQLYLMGNDGTQTVLTFDFNYRRPDKSTLELRQTVGGQPIALNGYQFVCKGTCYVSGQKLDIAAYRED